MSHDSFFLFVIIIIVLKGSEHALCGEFEHLPHGCRFRSLVCETNRRGNCHLHSSSTP